MLTGEILANPHLIVGESFNGELSAWNSKSDTDPQCAKWMYADGRGKAWGALPLQGTMSRMHLPTNVATFVGKTGTAERVGSDGNAVRDHSTNIVWAPFSVEMEDGQIFTTVTYLRPEKRKLTVDRKSGKTISVVQKDLESDMGYKLWAAEAAVPLSNQVLQILSEIHSK